MAKTAFVFIYLVKNFPPLFFFPQKKTLWALFAFYVFLGAEEGTIEKKKKKGDIFFLEGALEKKKGGKKKDLSV